MVTAPRSGGVRPTAEECLDAWLLTEIARAAIWADADAIERGWGADPYGYMRVHVAAGMLSAQLQITAEEAMSRIRAHAFASGASLTSVADTILDGRLRLA